MKKIVLLVIAAALLLSLSAGLVSCNGNKEGSNTIGEYTQPIDSQKSTYGTFKFEETYGDTARITDYQITNYKAHVIEIPPVIEVADKTLTVTSIGNEAFYSCTLATGVVIPDTVTSIGNFAFAMCSSLESITIPANVKTIGKGAFNGCELLKTVTLNSRIDKLTAEDGTVTDKVVGIEKIEQFAFMKCEKLESITFPTSLIEVENSAFAQCTSITEIVLPESVKTLDDMAFFKCTGVKKLVLPASLENIGSFVFAGISNHYVTAPAGSAAEKYVQENMEYIEEVTTEEETSANTEDTTEEATTAAAE